MSNPAWIPNKLKRQYMRLTPEEKGVQLIAWFKEGMNWNNYGLWEIDHIKPITSFEFKDYDDEEFRQCYSLGNLQPLWSKDNKVKQNFIGSKWGNK